jgi:type III secretory pathway lipoprotein EscJ
MTTSSSTSTSSRDPAALRRGPEATSDPPTTDVRSRQPWLLPTQVFALGIVATAVAWAAWSVREPVSTEQVELLPGAVLPAAELAVVEAAFDRAQLAGHRTDGGRIWVPRPRQSAYMRALVDAEALPREFGSSLRRALEKNSPWQSRSAQEEMLRVAVQEELAHVICTMPGIERAAVLYDCRERGGLDGLNAAPVRTASVNIRTQPDVELEPGRIQAIRVLVAASIAGLDAESVAVTDLRNGRVHTGPLSSPTADDALDPRLARQAAHERHLAAKLRQALSYVQGVVADVSVSLSAAEPDDAAPPAPRTDAARPSQRAADANAPAALEADVEPGTSVAGARAAGPRSIRATVAVPETHFDDVVRSARARDPAADAAAVVAVERERLLAVVHNVLPPTSDADGSRVVLSTYAVPRGPAPPGDAAAAADAPPPAARSLGMILDKALAALARGDLASVPREAWVFIIVLKTIVLVTFVLLGGARSGALRPASPPQIDWTTSDPDAGDPLTVSHRPARVAA